MVQTGRYEHRKITDRPKVILLDIRLPLVDGLEVLKQVKEDPGTKTISVVMLTSSREERDLVDSYRMGVNSYIVKPVDFDQFTEAARSLGMYWLLLNKPSTEAPSTAASTDIGRRPRIPPPGECPSRARRRRNCDDRRPVAGRR